MYSIKLIALLVTLRAFAVLVILIGLPIVLIGLNSIKFIAVVIGVAIMGIWFEEWRGKSSNTYR
jgi:hypothetical protein